MRLPADAVLLIIDAQQATDSPRPGAGDAPEAERAIAALVAAWRAEGLTLVHVEGRLAAPASSPAVPPLDGEIVIAGDGASAFAGTALEAGLDELGATTLVLCGGIKTHALEATAWHAADLGYQVFVVADACQAVDAVDLNGRLWPAGDVRALALARLKGETATIVDVGTAVRAAAAAKARMRRETGRA